MAKERSVFRIEISSDAVKTLHGITDKIGITHIAMMSKLIEWFHEQPSEIKAGVMGFNFEGLNIENPAVAYMKSLKNRK